MLMAFKWCGIIWCMKVTTGSASCRSTRISSCIAQSMAWRHCPNAFCWSETSSSSRPQMNWPMWHTLSPEYGSRPYVPHPTSNSERGFLGGYGSGGASVGCTCAPPPAGTCLMRLPMPKWNALAAARRRARASGGEGRAVHAISQPAVAVARAAWLAASEEEEQTGRRRRLSRRAQLLRRAAQQGGRRTSSRRDPGRSRRR